MYADVTMIVDLQFGSTGKGLICGYLAEHKHPDTAVCAWGPNAGHTYVNRHGKKTIVTMLPVSAHGPWCRSVLIGPGAVINLKSLSSEVRNARVEWGACFDLFIHPQACVVQPRHIDEERSHVKIGSTMKGTGAALIEKISRDKSQSPLVRDLSAHEFGQLKEVVNLSTEERCYNDAADSARVAFVEGAQGFSLGIHRGFWPHTTSREVTPAQLLSDCALPQYYIDRADIVGSMRTFPIRVANRFNERGEMIGYSGPPYPDQKEMDWQDLNIGPEYTTVTKLKRRIFSFSDMQVQDAIRMCGPTAVFLNFCNYLDKSSDMLGHIERTVRSAGSVVRWTGWGPSFKDVRTVDA